MLAIRAGRLQPVTLVLLVAVAQPALRRGPSGGTTGTTISACGQRRQLHLRRRERRMRARTIRRLEDRMVKARNADAAGQPEGGGDTENAGGLRARAAESRSSQRRPV